MRTMESMGQIGLMGRMGLLIGGGGRILCGLAYVFALLPTATGCQWFVIPSQRRGIVERELGNRPLIRFHS
jgi:hypothetical protein